MDGKFSSSVPGSSLNDLLIGTGDAELLLEFQSEIHPL